MSDEHFAVPDEDEVLETFMGIKDVDEEMLRNLEELCEFVLSEESFELRKEGLPIFMDKCTNRFAYMHNKFPAIALTLTSQKKHSDITKHVEFVKYAVLQRIRANKGEITTEQCFRNINNKMDNTMGRAPIALVERSRETHLQRVLQQERKKRIELAKRSKSAPTE